MHLCPYSPILLLSQAMGMQHFGLHEQMAVQHNLEAAAAAQQHLEAKAHYSIEEAKAQYNLEAKAHYNLEAKAHYNLEAKAHYDLEAKAHYNLEAKAHFDRYGLAPPTPSYPNQ